MKAQIFQNWITGKSRDIHTLENKLRPSPGNRVRNRWMSLIWRLEAWRILLQNCSLYPKLVMVLGLTIFNILSMHLFLYYREILYSTISKSDLGHFVPAGESQAQTGIHGAACWSIVLFQNVSHLHEKYHLCFHLLFLRLWLEFYGSEFSRVNI